MLFETPGKKILLTGAAGTLGRKISQLINCLAIDKEELDITDQAAVNHFMAEVQPDLVIHCAAYTDVAGAEKNQAACYQVNVKGTEYLVKAFNGQKFVYLSTEYVFDGQRGHYREDDIPNPRNFYALTKLLGEMIVQQYPSTLIIRTSFKPDGPWRYPKAFVDQWTSADYASQRAPQIIQAALMPKLLGLIHIGGERKTVYELARLQTPGVGTMSIADTNTVLPKDVSLDSSRWAAWQKKAKV